MSTTKKYTPNATACSLLGFLLDEQLSGWDLYKKAQLLIGDFWSLTRSQVYRELTTLEKQGLIEQGERGLRERQPYSITPAGREIFLAWLNEKPDVELIRFPLLIKLTFAPQLAPGKLEDFLDSQQRLHEERLRQYQQHKAAISQNSQDKQHLLVTLEFGIRYEEALLAWLPTARRQLHKVTKQAELNNSSYKKRRKSNGI